MLLAQSLAANLKSLIQDGLGGIPVAFGKQDPPQVIEGVAEVRMIGAYDPPPTASACRSVVSASLRSPASIEAPAKL